MVAVLSGVGGVGGCALQWRSPAELSPGKSVALPEGIMPMEQYGSVSATHARPYVFEQRIGPGSALVFGVEHVKDPSDPSIESLRTKARSFEPTVVLIEGRLGFHLGGLDGAIRKFGEPAAARALASDLGAKVYTWEPDRDTEVAMMLEQFPKDRVALMYILRPYFSNFRHGKPSDPDAAVESVRRKRTKWAGLEGTFGSVAEIDAVWQRDFAGLPDWRDTSDQWGWPGSLAALADFNRDIRTTHLARCVIDQCAKGERVLVVAGSSHAVRIEPALQAASGK